MEKNYFTEMYSGYEVRSYLKRINFVHHSTPGLEVIQKKKGKRGEIFDILASSGLVALHVKTFTWPIYVAPL